MTRSVYIDRPLADLEEKDRQDWRDWLARHHVTGQYIPLDSRIVYDDSALIITYQVYRLNAETGAVVEGQDGRPIEDLVTVQLYARAEPFPQGYPERNKP
jgi:hypothetical protein